MDPDRAQCPFCLKRLTVRSDGKLPKHRLTSRARRRGKRCAGSGMTVEKAREQKIAGKTAHSVDAGTEPKDIF